MYNASVSFLLKATDPFTSNSFYPVKYFEIPLVSVKYTLRYTPVTLHSGLMMADYIIASKQRLSKQANNELFNALREQYEADEFLVIEGSRSDSDASIHSLITFSERNQDKTGQVDDYTHYGQLNTHNDASILEQFQVAWRNNVKNLEIQRVKAFQREITRNTYIHRSVSFLRDNEKGLYLSLDVGALKNLERHTEISVVEHAVRDYVKSAEINYVLGGERDNSTQVVITSTESALRDSTHLMGLPSMQAFHRDYVKNMDIEYSFTAAERPFIFGLVNRYTVSGKRPIQKEGTVKWEHIIAERIIDASAIIQHTLTLSERIHRKEGFLQHSVQSYRDQLKQTVIVQAIEMGKLKARQFPSHIVYDLLQYDHVIERATHLLKNFEAKRDITDKLTLQQLGKSVRSIKKDITLEKINKAIRDTTHSLTNQQNLGESVRDIISNYHIHHAITDSVRDKTDSMAVKYVLSKFNRDKSHNGSVVYGNLKESIRDKTSDLYIPQQLTDSERIIDDRPTHILSGGLISSDRIITDSLTLEQGVHYERDRGHGLYLPTQPSAERNKTSLLDKINTETAIKDSSKPLYLHQMTQADREHVKDLLLSFIGHYVRKNQHDMVLNGTSGETGNGGSLPITTLDGFLMDDEIVAELVDDFALIIDSVFLGEQGRPTEGALLSEKMIAAREKIDAFINQGVLSADKQDHGGIVQFNTDMLASTEKNGLYEEGTTGQRSNSLGIMGEESLPGARSDSYGEIGESFEGTRPDKLGSNLEDSVAGDYGSEGIYDDEFTFGFINAKPSDFLTAEELATLQLDGGHLDEGQSLGQVVSPRNGYIEYSEVLGKALNNIRGGFLETVENVELMGLRPLPMDGHLLDEIILAQFIVKEKHGVIHETIEGEFFKERDSIQLDGVMFADYSKSATVPLDEVITGIRVSLGHIEDMIEQGTLQSSDGSIDSTVSFGIKETRPTDLIELIDSVKEKVTHLDNSHYFATILKDSVLEDDIQAIKEKTFHLHDLLVSIVPERHFTLTELEAFNKKELGGYIESDSLNASKDDKQGLVDQDLLGARFGKNGVVEKDLLGGRFGKSGLLDKVTDNLLGETYKDSNILDHYLAEKQEHGAVVGTENSEGTLQRPNLDGVITDEPVLGGRIDEFNGVVNDLYYTGKRTDPNGFINDEHEEGSIHRTGLGGSFTDDSIFGGRIDEFNGSVETEFTLGYKEAQGLTVSEEMYFASNTSSAGYVLTEMLISSAKDRLGLLQDSLIAADKFHDGYVEEILLFDKFEKDGLLEDSFLADKEDKAGTLENTILGYKDDKGGLLEDSLLVKKEAHGDIINTIESLKERLSVLEEEITATKADSYGFIESDSLFGWVNFRDSSLVDGALLAELPVRHSMVDNTSLEGKKDDHKGDNLDTYYMGINPSKHGTVEIEFLGERADWLGVNPGESDEFLGSSRGKDAATPAETFEASLLEKYSVTEEHLIEGEKLKWVGILTNLLFADEEKGHSYVEYLMDAGVIKPDHYTLLNGLVGDLVEKRGLAFGQDVVADLGESKAELIDHLQGQGLVYKYEDMQHVLEPGMEIEDWDLDLGFGLPENYDPYDPFNSFYPYLVDDYTMSSLSLQQLDDWIPFGGNNWRIDEDYGQITSIRDNENPNGYILNRFDYSNYKFSANFKVDLDSTDDDGIGVVFKYQNASNYHKFVIVGGAGNRVGMHNTFMQLYRVRNGVQQPIGSAMSPENWKKGEWYNIKVSYVDKRIQIWVNDRLQYDMIDYN